jgi:hypothetical protein
MINIIRVPINSKFVMNLSGNNISDRDVSTTLHFLHTPQSCQSGKKHMETGKVTSGDEVSHGVQ